MIKPRLIVILMIIVVCSSGRADELYGPAESLRWDLTALSPIGDLGDIETIIDIRGFIPMSGPSAIKSAGWDALHYHKLPTLEGVARLYYGDVSQTSVAKVAKAKLLGENNLKGETLRWTRLAYALTKTNSKELFVSVGGDTDDLESAEPIVVLMTHGSIFIVLNFRYSDFARVGTGQILGAFEFSSPLKEYKTFYRVRSTILFNKTARDVFSASLPIVAKVLAAQ